MAFFLVRRAEEVTMWHCHWRPCPTSWHHLIWKIILNLDMKFDHNNHFTLLPTSSSESVLTTLNPLSREVITY